jgi:hypothetical protein
MAVPAVSTILAMLVSARSAVASARMASMVMQGSSAKLTAASRCAALIAGTGNGRVRLV